MIQHVFFCFRHFCVHVCIDIYIYLYIYVCMFVLSTYIYIYICVYYIFYITYNDITFCINRCLMHLRRYNDIMIWYICLPTLALSSSPPKKKQKHSQREWTSQARHLNPYGPGGLVTTGPLWRVHGDVWKVRGQRVFGKPRFCSRKNPGNCGK